jgi:hypothetical protein
VLPELRYSGAADPTGRAEDSDHDLGGALGMPRMIDEALERGQGPRLPVFPDLSGAPEDVLLHPVFSLETEPVSLFPDRESAYRGVPHTQRSTVHMLSTMYPHSRGRVSLSKVTAYFRPQGSLV